MPDRQLNPLNCHLARRTLARRVARVIVMLLIAIASLCGPQIAIADDADESFALASAHYRRGQWKQAIEHFEVLITDYPNDPRASTAIYFLGEALVQQENYPAARIRFEQFVDAAPQHQFSKRAQFRIGETSYLAGEPDAAYRHLSAFYLDYPRDDLLEYALPYLGQLDMDRSEIGIGDGAAGIRYFETALNRFPNGVLADECRFGLGRALAEAEPAEAIRFFKHVYQRGKESLADNAALELGQIHFHAGHYAAAREPLAEFESRFVKSELLTDGLYWYGRTLARSENFVEAKRVLDLVIETDPDDDFAPAIYFEAAVVARQLDDRDESSRLLSSLIKQWPDSEWLDESLLILAQNEYQAKRYAKVVDHCERFNFEFELSEFRQNMLELQGKSLLSLKQNARSNEIFQELIRMSDGLPVAQAKIATWNYLLGLGMFRIENTEAAIAAFEIAAKNSTDEALQSAVNLAKSTIYLDRREYAAAVVSLEAYLKVTNDGASRRQVQAELARAYAISGRIDDAAMVMKQLQVDPKADELVLQLAGNLAEYAYRREDFERSVEWFDLLTADTDKANVARGVSGVAWSQAALGRNKKAVETFATLIENHPDSRLTDEAILKQGILQAELKRTEAAIETLCRFESDYRDSQLWSEAILNLVRITNASGQKEHLEIAAEQIEKLMAAKTDLQADDEFLYQLAWLQNDLGDQKSSEKTFRTISHRHRSSKYWADASYRVAEIAVHENRLDEAQEILDQLINTGLDSTGVAVHGLYLQGKIAVDQRDWPSVERLMLQLVQKHPDHELALVGRYWRAEAAYRLQNYDVAMKRFDELHSMPAIKGTFAAGTREPTNLRGEPPHITQLTEHTAAILPGMLLRRSQLWAKKDAWNLAKRLSDEFIAEYPRHEARYEADYIIGRFHAREGQYTDARKSFDAVLSNSSARATETAAMAQFMIGESWFHQEIHDKAIKAYHKAEILHSYSRWQSASLLQGGKCYELKKQWHDAIVCYERLLEDFAATEYAGEATKRLKNAQNMTAK